MTKLRNHGGVDMLFRMLLCFIFILCNVLTVFSSEICLPDYMIGQLTYKDSSCRDNIIVRRDSEYFLPPSGQCLMYNDTVTVKGSCVVKIVSKSKSVYIGRQDTPNEWKAPEKKIVHTALHEDNAFLRIVSKLFETQAISKLVVSQGGADESAEMNSNSAALAALANLPVGKQKIGTDLKELLVAWKDGSGIGFAEASLSRGGAVVPGSASRVCWKAWTTIPLPAGLAPGEQLVLKVVDAQGNQLQWNVEVCAANALPPIPAAASSSAMAGLWRLLRAPAEYRMDALSRLSGDSSDVVTARGIFNAVLADTPIGEGR